MKSLTEEKMSLNRLRYFVNEIVMDEAEASEFVFM